MKLYSYAQPWVFRQVYPKSTRTTNRQPLQMYDHLFTGSGDDAIWHPHAGADHHICYSWNRSFVYLVAILGIRRYDASVFSLRIDIHGLLTVPRRAWAINQLRLQQRFELRGRHALVKH